MCRRLGKVLFLFKIRKRQHIPLLHIRKQYIFLFLILLGHVHREEAVKAQLAAAHREDIVSGPQTHRFRIVYGIFHTGCQKTAVDQLVQPELISSETLLRLQRRDAEIGRADGLVGILDLHLTLGLLLHRSCHIIVSVLLRNIAPCLSVRLIRNTGGIGTQVGDETHGAVPFDIDTLIQRLGDPHGLRGREGQQLRRLLLQGTGGKGQRCLFPALGFPDVLHHEVRLTDASDNVFGLLFGAEGDFFVLPVESGLQLLLSQQEICGEAPVLLRHKGSDFCFAVADHLQCNRLYPSCRQTLPDLLPEQRTDGIAHQTIHDPARLLRVHQIHIDLPGLLQCRAYRVLRDLIEADAGNLLFIGRILAKLIVEMPADGLTLTVRVSREINAVCLLGFLLQLAEELTLSPDGDVFRCIIMLHIHPEGALRHINEMPHCRIYRIIFSQKLADGLHLGGRLHNNQIICHVCCALR